MLRLFRVLEYTTELGRNQIDHSEQLGDQHLPSLKANVDVAISMCDCVLQKEGEFDSVSRIDHRRVLSFGTSSVNSCEHQHVFDNFPRRK